MEQAEINRLNNTRLAHWLTALEEQGAVSIILIGTRPDTDELMLCAGDELESPYRLACLLRQVADQLVGR